MVLLSARPFRVGDRIRLQGGGLAGTTDGTVQSLGLLYVTLGQGSDQMMVPNSVVLSVAVTPLREPDAVDFQARLRAGVKVSDVQRLLAETVTVPTRGVPHIDLEGMDDDEVVVRISAVPVDAEDGWRLADEVLQAVDRITRDEITVEHIVGRADPAGGRRRARRGGARARDGGGAGRRRRGPRRARARAGRPRAAPGPATAAADDWRAARVCAGGRWAWADDEERISAGAVPLLRRAPRSTHGRSCRRSGSPVAPAASVPPARRRRPGMPRPRRVGVPPCSIPRRAGAPAASRPTQGW